MGSLGGSKMGGGWEGRMSGEGLKKLVRGRWALWLEAARAELWKAIVKVMSPGAVE